MRVDAPIDGAVSYQPSGVLTIDVYTQIEGPSYGPSTCFHASPSSSWGLQGLMQALADAGLRASDVDVVVGGCDGHPAVDASERLRLLFEATLPCVRPAKLAELVLWTVVAWGGYMATMVILADGLAVRASQWSVISASALGGLTTLLPISFQGVGTREPMFVFVLGREGVSLEQAVLLAMLGFWVMFLTAIAIGLIGIAGQAAQRRSTPPPVTTDSAPAPGGEPPAP